MCCSAYKTVCVLHTSPHIGLSYWISLQPNLIRSTLYWNNTEIYHDSEIECIPGSNAARLYRWWWRCADCFETVHLSCTECNHVFLGKSADTILISHKCIYWYVEVFPRSCRIVHTSLLVDIRTIMHAWPDHHNMVYWNHKSRLPNILPRALYS